MTAHKVLLAVEILNGALTKTGIGEGSKRTERRMGGELAPKVAPRRLGVLTPKLAIFLRISVERCQLQGPLRIQNFRPPLIFGDLTPPPPIPNSKLSEWGLKVLVQ